MYIRKKLLKNEMLFQLYQKTPEDLKYDIAIVDAVL